METIVLADRFYISSVFLFLIEHSMFPKRFLIGYYQNNIRNVSVTPPWKENQFLSILCICYRTTICFDFSPLLSLRTTMLFRYKIISLNDNFEQLVVSRKSFAA